MGRVVFLNIEFKVKNGCTERNRLNVHPPAETLPYTRVIRFLSNGKNFRNNRTHPIASQVFFRDMDLKNRTQREVPTREDSTRAGSYLKRYQADRNALTIFKRAARTAGRNPPSSPIVNEKNIDHPMMDGDNAKLNSNSEND